MITPCPLHPLELTGPKLELKTGDSLFRRGDRCRGLFWVISGRIKLLRYGPDGSEMLLHQASADQLLAEASLFSGVYHCDAIAAQPSVAVRLDKQLVSSTLAQDPDMNRRFMAHLARQVQGLRGRLEQRNLNSASDRVLHYLALHSDGTGKITLPGTLKDLSTELGLAHETLYRTVRKLETTGTIKRKGNVFWLI